MPIERWFVSALCVLATSPAVAMGQLAYTESSAGLQLPGMEGGRTELEFGDVNGDANLDLVSIGDHGSPFIGSGEHGVMVWFGDGAGNWSLSQTGDFGYGGIGLGDVNGDGWMDVGYGMHHDYSGTDFGDQLLEVALGDGTGTNWSPWDDGLATSGETWGMFAVDFADVDNDGDLDIGSISFGCCAGIHVYLNQGDGTWTQSFGFTGGNSYMEFQFGDVNGDGLADFAASHGNGTVYLGDGLGGFALEDGNLPAASLRRGVSLGDVNGDGRDDLAFRGSGGGLEVWSWVAAGTWLSLSGTLPTTGDHRFAQIADMNVDGHGDVAAYRPGFVEVYTGNGAGAWQLAATIPWPGETCGYSAMRAGADADHNGFPDVALIVEEDCDIFTGGTNRPRFFRETSTPSSRWVFPVSPRGGESFHAGSVRFLDWTAAAPGPAGQLTVNVELSLFGAQGPWISIASRLPNNGRYQWQLPTVLPSSTTCHLRYTLGDASTVTPRPFTIVGGLPAGDCDGDGDVDLVDYAAYATCLTGPAGIPRAGCDCFDFDDSGTVDLRDFALLQVVFD